jgi:hypothetical protein
MPDRAAKVNLLRDGDNPDAATHASSSALWLSIFWPFGDDTRI